MKKRTALLASAALVLAIGSSPVLAQNTNPDKNKDQTIQSEKSERNTQSRSDRQEGPTRSSDSKVGAEPSKETSQSQPSSSRKAQSERKDSTQQRQTDRNADTRSSQSNPQRSTEQNRSPSERQQSTQTDRNASQPSSTNANRAAPSQQNNASAPTAGRTNEPARASASLDPQRKERLSAAIGRLDAQPVSRVDFSVSVGAVVPSHVSLRPLPSTIVEIVPQYRGYDFLVVRDEVVIVEPRTHKIVDVIERSGPSHARAESRERLKLSDKQREVIRKHVSSRRATTGSSRQIEVEVGRKLPDTVEIESFPEEVYREVPEIRSYRYIERGGDVYLVDPSDREVIEEIR
jgi:hypothetical protein